MSEVCRLRWIFTALMAGTLKPEDILTPEELAARLKVSKSWAYEQTRSRRWARGDSIPCLRIGKYVRFDWTKVVEWLTDPKRNGTPRRN